MFRRIALIKFSAVMVAVIVGAFLLANFRVQGFAKEAADKPSDDAAVSQAAIAYQLAIQGQRSKSPVLMLAAIEMIGVLKTGTAPSDLKTESSASQEAGDAAVSLDPAEWQEKAREYAKDDKKLLAFVEDRIEKMSSREIINAPEGSYQKYFGSTRYTVLSVGFLDSGETATLTNIRVRGGEFACVGVIGEIDSELVFEVKDDKAFKQAGESFRGLSIYSWTPKRTHACSVSVTNSGKRSAYVIVGH